MLSIKSKDKSKDGKTKLKTFRNIFVGSKSDFYQINDKLPKYKRFAK